LMVATCRMTAEVRERFGPRVFAWIITAAATLATLRVIEEVAKAA